MELLFLTPKEIAKTTVMGGNVERDKYSICIQNVQLTSIEPMLGTLLYDKIVSELESNTITGDYEVLFNDYIKPITKNLTLAEYIPISPYVLGNKGLMKNTSENSNVVTSEEANNVASLYRTTAQAIILRFEKWIRLNPLPEFVNLQDEVNPTEVEQSFNWFFK